MYKIYIATITTIKGIMFNEAAARKPRMSSCEAMDAGKSLSRPSKS